MTGVELGDLQGPFQPNHFQTSSFLFGPSTQDVPEHPRVNHAREGCRDDVGREGWGRVDSSTAQGAQAPGIMQCPGKGLHTTC